MNFKTSSAKVISVLTFAIICSIFTVSAQKNHYGMVLSGSEGNYLQSVALCDAVLKKGGRAEKNIYENYVHAFYNKGNSDRFEDITLKMYSFARSVFKMQ